jgi:hypothetical protein
MYNSVPSSDGIVDWNLWRCFPAVLAFDRHKIAGCGFGTLAGTIVKTILIKKWHGREWAS